MKKAPNRIQKLALVLALGVIPAIACQFFTREPVSGKFIYGISGMEKIRP
jgi:hypothetical protein